MFEFLCLKNYPVEICLEKHKMGLMYNPLQIKPQRQHLSMFFCDSQEMFYEKQDSANASPGPTGLVFTSFSLPLCASQRWDVQSFLVADWSVRFEGKTLFWKLAQACLGAGWFGNPGRNVEISYCKISFAISNE